jgi:hypothetical protein
MKLKKEDLKRIIREEVDSHLSGPEPELQGPREGSVQGLDVPNESMYPQLFKQFAAVLQGAFGPNVNVYQELINIAEFDASAGKRIPYREGKKGMFDQPDFKSKVAWVKRNKPEVDDPDAYVAGALRKAGELKEDKKHSVQ